MQKESIRQILLVSLGVCLTCSIVVSGAAVFLRNEQDKNTALERQINILLAAGLLAQDEISAARVQQLFDQVETQLVDLESGTIVKNADPAQYDQREAMRDPQLSRTLTRKEDIAGLGRLEKYAEVYFVTKENNLILVLPVRGYGLWSTLYGYLALDGKDLNTIIGLTFAEHKETPGLGGEVDNPKWKAQWPGKKLFDEKGDLAIKLVKGSAAKEGQELSYQVDALSGASLTSRGVNNLLQFWFGEMGYGKFIDNLKKKNV